MKLPAILILIIAALTVSCKHAPVKMHPSFKAVFGVKFTEVHRTFGNGVSFSDHGFELEPNWKLTFLSDDSVNIYSPGKKRYFNCPVLFDHDSIFNIAWAWLKLKKLGRDSIVFQVLHVGDDKVISYDRSNMFMTLYANTYIQNKLHTTAAMLQRPRRKDSLYVQDKIKLAAEIPDSIFAARLPAVLKSASPLLTIKPVDAAIDSAQADEPPPTYVLPEYNVNITKAYQDFYYSFSVIIDAQGQMHFFKSTTHMEPEFAASTIHIMKALINGYLKHYLAVSPGRTLGYAHSSMVLLNVRGTK